MTTHNDPAIRADDASDVTDDATYVDAAEVNTADAPVRIVSGNPDAAQALALSSVIAELAAEAKAQRATQPRRGDWGELGEGLQPVESFNPRSFQNLHDGR